MLYVRRRRSDAGPQMGSSEVFLEEVQWLALPNSKSMGRPAAIF